MISSGQVEPKWNNVSLPDPKKNVQVGSENCNDVLSQDKEFVAWKMMCFHRTKNLLHDRSSIRTKHWGQSRMGDWRIGGHPSRKEHKKYLHCTLAMHTKCRNLLGQINWLQSRRQFQCCYKSSRCASRAASPTIVDVKALNKLARQLKSQPMELQCWPRTGPLRLIAFPDASHRTM